MSFLFQCNFDRECCKGWECRMSVTSQSGVGNYCEKKYSRLSANESNSPEDDFWMVAGSRENHEDEEENRETNTVKHTDAMDDISEIQDIKRLDLQKENQELERLFTEKDQEDLEKLRAIKEDMELDELRTLKELRLKRKLQLLKELRELKAIKAEETLNAITTKENKTLFAGYDEVTTNSLNSINTQNQSTLLETSNEDIPVEKSINSIDEYSQTLNSTGDTEHVDQTETNPTQLSGIDNTEQTEQALLENKQGIHSHHHKRKHQNKHRRKQ